MLKWRHHANLHIGTIVLSTVSGTPDQSPFLFIICYMEAYSRYAFMPFMHTCNRALIRFCHHSSSTGVGRKYNSKLDRACSTMGDFVFSILFLLSFSPQMWIVLFSFSDGVRVFVVFCCCWVGFLGGGERGGKVGGKVISCLPFWKADRCQEVTGLGQLLASCSSALDLVTFQGWLPSAKRSSQHRILLLS